MSAGVFIRVFMTLAIRETLPAVCVNIKRVSVNGSPSAVSQFLTFKLFSLIDPHESIKQTITNYTIRRAIKSTQALK